MLGANISSREKVAAAIKAIVRTSSRDGFFTGINATAIQRKNLDQLGKLRILR
jgi:predicted kinase